MKIEEAVRYLESNKRVAFKDLLEICETFFGKARTKGSHFIFKVPWFGRINIQRDKKDAKKYQVKQVLSALKKLQSQEEGQ